jgi:hypothetical protein
MAISDKINMLVSAYVRRTAPTLSPEFLANYLQEELREIEASIKSLSDRKYPSYRQRAYQPKKGHGALCRVPLGTIRIRRI